MAILIYGSGGGEGTSVADTTAVQSDVLPGKYFYLADGTKVEGSMATKAAATIIPATTNQEINAGQYLAGKQTIQGSANLKAENIKDGVNIFGVTGNHSTAIKFYEGNATANSSGRITLSGYDFTPYGVCCYLLLTSYYNNEDVYKIMWAKLAKASPLATGNKLVHYSIKLSNGGVAQSNTTKIYSVSNTSITLDTFVQGDDYMMLVWGA